MGFFCLSTGRGWTLCRAHPQASGMSSTVMFPLLMASAAIQIFFLGANGIPFVFATARSKILTLAGAGGRAALPGRAPGRDRAGRAHPQLAAPVRTSPSSVEARGQQPAAPAAREGNAGARGDGRGRALPAPIVRRPPQPARRGAAGLGGRAPRNVAVYAAAQRRWQPRPVATMPVACACWRAVAKPGSRRSKVLRHAEARHR